MRDYQCMFCNSKFKKDARYFEGDAPLGITPRHKGNGSDQVRCPHCNQFIPTWKREETGNSIGKLHIHIRK